MRIKDSPLFIAFSLLICAVMAWSLIFMVTALPEFGAAYNPAVNEVEEKYLTDGITDTGATNAVAGMILDYRAFDTLGESCVLFVASISVLILLRYDGEQRTRNLLEHEERFEPEADVIVRTCFKFLIPVILMFGIYVIMNGHLSPGGGFSGGAILSGALILYVNAYGYDRAEGLINNKRHIVLTTVSLCFYCLAKSYSFYTGANGLENKIPKGTPGAILSSGLILPLNICVGIVVCCTMYTIYILFRRGGFRR